MFNKIKEYFGGDGSIEVDSSGEPTSEDLQIATAVILLEMAGRDEDYAKEEVRSIADVIKTQFQISDDAVIDFLEHAEEMRQQSEKIDNFVNLINQNFSKKQRITIMAMLWKVVVADGSIDKFEERFTTQMKYRLQLEDEEVAEAKKMARQGVV